MAVGGVTSSCICRTGGEKRKDRRRALRGHQTWPGGRTYDVPAAAVRDWFWSGEEEKGRKKGLVAIARGGRTRRGAGEEYA